MGSDTYHEPVDLLSERTRNLHRAIVSLMEELEAIDWYQQRAEACSDPELAATLVHNQNEEIEHAMMVLEWLRRNHGHFDAMMKQYLFTTVPILDIEKSTAKSEADAPTTAPPVSLGIGSLKRR